MSSREIPRHFIFGCDGCGAQSDALEEGRMPDLWLYVETDNGVGLHFCPLTERHNIEVSADDARKAKDDAGRIISARLLRAIEDLKVS